MRITRLVVAASVVAMCTSRSAAAQQGQGSHAFTYTIQIGNTIAPLVSFAEAPTSSAAARAGRSGNTKTANGKAVPITIKVYEISPSLAVWITSAMSSTGAGATKDFEVYRLNSNNDADHAWAMLGAVIAQVTLPRLDSANMNAVHVTVEIVPATQRTAFVTNGSKLGTAKPTLRWTGHHYRVTIPGLVLGPSVKRVDAIDLRPHADCPGFTMIVDQAGIATAEQAFAAQKTTNGEIEYLAPDFKTLGRLQFTGLRVAQVDKVAGHGGQSGTAQVRFSCTGVTLDFPTTH